MIPKYKIGTKFINLTDRTDINTIVAYDTESNEYIVNWEEQGEQFEKLRLDEEELEYIYINDHDHEIILPIDCTLPEDLFTL